MRYLNRALAMAVFCAIGAAQPVWAGQSDWQRFRANHPYHIQTIVLGPDAPGGRTLIVSEPPPNVTVAAMRQRWPAEFKDARIHKHAIGVDGWVSDIVTRLPPQSEDATRELVQQLTGYLFGTSYKSYVLPIEPVARGGRADLDVSVSTGQLSRWLGLERPTPGPVGRSFSGLLWLGMLLSIAAVARTRRIRWVKAAAACAAILFMQGYFYQPPPPEVRFVQRHAANRPQSMEGILNGGGGVYDSDNRGLVLLVLPRTASLDSNLTALREFVLDTDAILGAVGTDRTTAIVGRERIVPVDVMPPLRVETLLQLASVKSGELAQSYERNNLLAGRFDSERNRDWAPIFLSDELKDTEYGSLLNITDQLLKSWSQHGQVRYANFKYADPAKYPFPVPLSTHAKARSVTFNWNTKGVGYLDAVGNFKLLAFARTGSLPVDYLGARDSRLRDAEDIAYEYFATSGDPNLARVVQYAGAYQIFRLFEITGTNPYPKSKPSHDREGLERIVGRLLLFLREAPLGDLEKEFSGSSEEKDQFGEFRQLIAALNSLHQAYGPKSDTDLSAAVIEPRTWAVRANRSGSDYDQQVLQLAYGLMGNGLVKGLVGDRMSRFALTRYLGASAPVTKSYIRTASVVVSWPTGADAATVTGGHSLSSRITRYAADDSLAAGDVKVLDGAGGVRTILYSGRDESRIHATVRSAGRAEDLSPDQLRGLLRQEIQRAQPRFGPMREVLKSGDAQVVERGLGSHAGVRVSSATWIHRSDVHPSHAAWLKTQERPRAVGIVIERQPNGILMSVQGESGSIYAPDTVSAIDAFVARTRTATAGASKVDVIFADFDAEQARSFIRSAELHSAHPLRGRVNAMIQVDGTSGAIARARKIEWDVAAARLESRRIDAVGGVQHLLEIPAARGTASPLRLVVEATAEAASRVRALLSEFMVAIRSLKSADELFAALHDFMAQLTAIPGVKKVRPIQIEEAGDTFIVRHEGAGTVYAAV